MGMLDTHALLWTADADPQLSQRVLVLRSRFWLDSKA